MKRLAMLAALALGACTQAPARQASPSHGAAQPRIVSLNPCTDAILAEVADPSQIAALSHYSSDPASSSMDLAAARRLPSVSGSVEEVLALRPDVVVSGDFLPPATVNAFARLGLPLVQLPIASTVAESRAQVTQLARLAGHGARAVKLNARIDAALASARPPAGSTPIPAVVWQSGGIVPGDNTLIAELLARTGFANFTAARGMGQADFLPLETMLADPPRVILAVGNPLANEDRMLAHPALATLKDTRRETLASSFLWCGGPTIIRAAGRLAEIRGGVKAR